VVDICQGRNIFTPWLYVARSFHGKDILIGKPAANQPPFLHIYRLVTVEEIVKLPCELPPEWDDGEV
jgi:hypothetical protein